MNAAVEAIAKQGGADRVVLYFLNAFLADADKRGVMMGMLSSDEHRRLSRTMLGTAAIHSIMAARRDLRDSPENEKASERLLLAEKAFLLSWHLDKPSLMEVDGPADLDHEPAANAALANWRNADLDRFPFVVPI